MKKVLFFLSFIFFAFSANSKTLEQKFNVNIGIFDAAKVNMSYFLDDNSYNFLSEVTTDGLFAKLYYFNAQYNTYGKIINNKFIAQDYNYISKSRANIRTKQLIFDKHGVLIERISSKNNKEKNVKIDSRDKIFDFNDLQSVFAYLTKQLKDNQDCNMQKKVFDGKKAYQISIKEEGQDYINDNLIKYKGSAKKCSMYIKRTDNEDEDMLFKMTADKPVYFWIAYEKTTRLPFLVKIEIDSTPLGKLKAYTTYVNIRE